jgi:hypothetical protein
MSKRYFSVIRKNMFYILFPILFVRQNFVVSKEIHFLRHKDLYFLDASCLWAFL